MGKVFKAIFDAGEKTNPLSNFGKGNEPTQAATVATNNAALAQANTATTNMENVPVVLNGGSASESVTMAETELKKKRGATMTSQLGINV